MSLTGIWTNELRSKVLLVENSDHSPSGLYHSIVGRDSGIRPLSGRTSAIDGAKQMLAFAVCFEIEPPPGYGRFSVCGWTGWGERDELGAELVKTHSLLTSNTL
jgi:Avidin family